MRCFRAVPPSTPPSLLTSIQDLVESIKLARIDFESPVWQIASPEARDLITQLLAPDPRLRPSAHRALKHPWFHASGSQDPIISSGHTTPHPLGRERVKEVLSANLPPRDLSSDRPNRKSSEVSIPEFQFSEIQLKKLKSEGPVRTSKRSEDFD